MEIGIKYIPHEASRWDVVRAIAGVLHSDAFRPQDSRKENFQVELTKSNVSDFRNGGMGFLTIPTDSLAIKLLRYVEENPVRIKDPATGQNKKIKFFRDGDRSRRPPKGLIETLAKTPWVDPDNEEKHQKKLAELADQFRLDSIQFGTFFRDQYPANDRQRLLPRSFSIEYKQDLTDGDVGWLKFEYDHKLIRITISNPVMGEIGHSIAIKLSSIQKIGVGYDGKPYACFDTLVPPVFESFEYHYSQSDDSPKGGKKYKQRIGALSDAHRVIAPFSPHLRLLFTRLPDRDTIEKFVEMCKASDISDNLIIRCDLPQVPKIEALSRGLFTRKSIYCFQQAIRSLPWGVGFQLEGLLFNGLLHTEEVTSFLSQVRRLCKAHPRNDSAYVDDLLRKYAESLRDRPPAESPMKCFDRVERKYTPPKLTISSFRCRHVTFTPTRMLMEGPYPTQSNRIIRQFAGYEDFFIRVDFRDEDRLQYRWSRDVDGASFIRDRVGTTLKNGFEIAGRHFEFLAYSSSALREHAVWFMCPFQHGDPKYGWVDSEKIRDQIGDFKKSKLIRQPSKYAARLAQAFTATEASVSIARAEWEQVKDIKPSHVKDGDASPNLFTDGVGSISRTLGDKIWAELCLSRRDRGERSMKPSAYQIRFLGYKGVVAVDEQLDKLGNGIHMRLRESMCKFEVANDDIAPIEIAQAFEHPNVCYLNRPLVMLLEDLGVSKDAFLALQDEEVSKARTIHDSIDRFRSVLWGHGLGRPFRFSHLIKQLQDLGLEINNKDPGKPNIDTPFLRQVREVAMVDILRDIKHSARILVPDSHLLVGIADEGPAYVEAGFENVYCLPPGSVYVCVQKAYDQEPEWLEGHCMVTRSPVAHIGDVQRVRAIGKPPKGMLCLFAHIKNVLVMSSQGKRSLASCLGGGDVDGDLFQIIQYEPLLPMTYELPMNYDATPTKTIEHDCTVDDICDFVVEYINSDVLGLLSDRLLMIADQSTQGMNDEDCIHLAELCSEAVDYPKNGNVVDLSQEKLPRPLIRCKPDWHAAEVVSPREIDYYISTRALGELYRSITLTKPEQIQQIPGNREPLRDPISQFLREKVEYYIGDDVYPTKKISPALETTYQRYVDELNYIRSTHTVSNTPGAKLLEAEVVAGSILAQCPQKRWRSDRMYRMRLHTTTLVKEIKNEILPQAEHYTSQELVEGLGRAWRAWELSQMRPFNEEGANSFGFLALDIILDVLERLKTDSPSPDDEATNDTYDLSDLESEFQGPELI
ncbi:RdRP-domain-containing protein [Macrolepiota fuliginosa MF-IS2]|uniref:RNA-dependent RNA polymerase n=1 Tax=Macrolepiota fuliginosa MF-IS2 TaxID=1400762 RepID=A0A9P6C8L3_9AGAR|nr:RdRP-domain-containing protein [Macrolepiota fuliginosa MF-IS2]